MKAEHLLDAMEHIDDELILEANERPVRRKRPLWQVATAAAAAVVVCAGLYILPAMQPAGMAAPENQGAGFDMFQDTADVASGTLADGALLDEYKYKTESEQSSLRAPSTAAKDGVGEMGVCEPVFHTEQGRYLLVGEELPIKSKLPEDAQYLGELVETNYDKPAFPSVGTKELVGCAVWQSKDGDYLYIQSPAGGWLQATRQK